MGIFDMIAIMLVIIVISVIIGLNIVSVVGQKLSEVQINIPPQPKPNIIVNINKKDMDKYQISVKENDKINDIVGLKESFDGNLKLNGLDEYKRNILENPEESDVVEYEQYVCQKNIDNKKIQNNILKKNKQNTIINPLNKITCESKINNVTGTKDLQNFNTCKQNNINGEKYYKIFRAYPSSLQDTKLRGYNISNFSGSAGIYDIGKINLDNNLKFAKPNNYLFQ